jgi:2-oxo-3-hexenedioate decarboxylase
MRDLAALADRLHEAASTASAVPRLTATDDLNVLAAYEIQRLLVKRRLSQGEHVVGLKMGLTSQAKMAQMGVSEAIWGRLTSGMRVPDGGTVAPARFIHPRVEPEVAFLLDGGGAPQAVATALELIDSRYADFRFQLPDVIADNTSAAGFVLGPWRPVPDGLDNLGVLLEVNGRVVETGSTAAILGDPRRALAAGLRMAGAAGEQVRDGWVFLAGAATAAIPLTSGDHARAVVEGVGSAEILVYSSRPEGHE